MGAVLAVNVAVQGLAQVLSVALEEDVNRKTRLRQN